MIDGADRTVVALNNDRVVGFALALCDGASNGYISIASGSSGLASPRYRLAASGASHAEDSGRITWVLRAGRESSGFWERLGFVASEIAMERVPQY
jgi:hypothetical protein